jgi:predicted dehydrogenase
LAAFEDGHRSMRIMEAILQSHKEERWVKVQA